MSSESGLGLEISDLFVTYGRIPVVHGVSLAVAYGEVVVLLGANGAGKTSTLQAIAGVIGSSGKVRIGGRPAEGSLDARARRGLAYLPEGRSVIRRLSVSENLRIGIGAIDRVLEIAPELRALLGRKAGLLSGGEQQILCLARLLATDPRVLIADEMSLGLAPRLVVRMLSEARRAADNGAAVLLVEQHAHQALSVADRGYVLDRGKVVMGGSAEALREKMTELERVYLTGAIPAPRREGAD